MHLWMTSKHRGVRGLIANINVFSQLYCFVICNVNDHLVLNDASTFSNIQL